MAIAHMFQAIAGVSREDCFCLAYRYEDEHGFDADLCDSWVVRVDGPRLYPEMIYDGWLVDLWVGPRSVWVAHDDGTVSKSASREPGEPDWEEMKVNPIGGLSGIWGSAEDSVFAWGTDRAGKPAAFHYDGSQWRPVAIAANIAAMSGVGDVIFAVGSRGLIARWNGSDAFVSMESPVNTSLCSVHVVSPDEMYACAIEGDVLRGTEYGWEQVLRHDHTLACIAKHGDHVWVGAGKHGVYSLQGSTLVLEKDNIHAIRFDARAILLTTAPDMMAEPVAHPKWKANRIGGFVELTTRCPPMWEG
jgi:hypothetical protein